MGGTGDVVLSFTPPGFAQNCSLLPTRILAMANTSKVETKSKRQTFSKLLPVYINCITSYIKMPLRKRNPKPKLHFLTHWRQKNKLVGNRKCAPTKHHLVKLL